jgi:hypothetical protein
MSVLLRPRGVAGEDHGTLQSPGGGAAAFVEVEQERARRG